MQTMDKQVYAEVVDQERQESDEANPRSTSSAPAGRRASM